MPSIFTRIASLMPGFSSRPMPPALVQQPVESPDERRHRIITETQQQLKESTRRQSPSTSEKVPLNYHAGIAGKVWFLPYHDSTTKDTPEIRQAMRLMRRDGYVKAAWEPQILTVASEDWQIQPSESGNQEAEEQAKFVRTVFEDYLAGGMPQLVRAITAALGSDGHTVSEKVWEYAERGRLQGRIVIAAAKTKDTQEGTGQIRLEGDHFGNVEAVRVVRKPGLLLPITDFLYARYMPVFDEPLGEAAYRPAYGPYWMRDTVRKLRAIHHEKKMAGMLVGTYTADDDKGPLEDALKKAKTSTWLSVPEGTRIEAIQLSTAAEPDYKSFDESLRDEIVMSIAFAILQQLVGGNAGDVRGNAEVQKKISDLGPWMLMAIVMDVVNTQLIPDLIDFNYPYPAAQAYPKLTFGAVSNPEILEQQQVVFGAAAGGMKPSLKYYAKAWSIQLADPNDPSDAMKAAAAGAGATGLPGSSVPSLQFAERRTTSKQIREALQRFAGEFAA